MKELKAKVNAAASPRQDVAFLSDGGHLRDIDPTSTSFSILLPPSKKVWVCVTRADRPSADQSRNTFSLCLSRLS